MWKPRNNTGVLERNQWFLSLLYPIHGDQTTYLSPVQAEIERTLIDALRQRKCQVVERSDCQASESESPVGDGGEEEVCSVVQREECGDPFEQCERQCGNYYSCQVCPLGR